jgi:Holliday junction resolvasome RuvABC endonuclease subunit
MAIIKVAGLDGSLRNFGISKMLFDTDSYALSVDDLILIETEKTKSKQVRASSDSFESARALAEGAQKALADCHVCFAEIPFGGKSYAAVLGFGIVIGTYAGISLKVPLIEVAPAETKKSTVGTRTASKEEMIDWAFNEYPAAPWLTVKRGGKLVPTQKNEHLADGCAVVHAGIKTPAFRQVAAILAASQAKAA